jgi:hypothetical protein
MRFTTGSSPLRKTLIYPIKTLLVGAILITPPAIAYADEDLTRSQDPQKLKRQILASLDDPELALEPLDDPSEKSWFAGFRVSKKGPIQFRRTVLIGEDEVLIKLYGPVVKRKPGLRFKVEGLRIGDNPVNMEGYGNSKGGFVRFTIRY